MRLRYPIALATFSLLVSSCTTLGYEVEEIIANPVYQDFTARTAVLPPMPNFGAGAGDLDSARITVNEDGEINITSARYEYAADTTFMYQRAAFGEEGDEFSFEASYDTKIAVPVAPGPDGETTSVISSLDSATNRYLRDGRRVTTRVAGRVTGTVDYRTDESGDEYVSSRLSYAYNADGTVRHEVAVADYTADGVTVYAYDSLNYYYEAGALARFSTYAFDRDFDTGEEGILPEDSGRVTVTDERFTHASLLFDAPDDPYELEFNGPNVGYTINGFEITRTDDGTDERYRAYEVRFEDDGEVFGLTYEFYYRSPVTGTSDLPALATELTSANPIAPGQALAFGDVPAGARYAVTDATGRVIAAGALASRQSVAFPAAAAGAYVVTVTAPGFAPGAWTRVVR